MRSAAQKRREADILQAEIDQIVNRADEAGRDWTRYESKRIDDLLNEIDELGLNRRAAPNRTNPRNLQRSEFSNLGEFAKQVRRASNPEHGPDAIAAQDILNAAPTSYGSEGIGPDGGFAVPAEFRSEILRKCTGDDALVPRCDPVPTSSNAAQFPKDETTPWGTTGIQAYWDGEAHLMTQKKPLLENSTIRCHKLTALVPVTDELLEDAPAMSNYLTTRGSAAIVWKSNDAIVNGTGAGMPLGIMNSPCLITVSKEGSQAAATIVGENVLKMYSRMYAPWRRDAVWLAHDDCLPQLLQLNVKIKNVAGTENVGGHPIYVPGGTIADQPQDTLLGRPILYTQAAQALGTKGDLVFAALSQYAAVQRTPGIRTDTSIHLFFDYGVTAFRFTFRMGGQPWWSAPLTPKNGTNTLSPFVALETR